MNKPKFNTITQSELNAYVIAHQEDKKAFYALADRLRAQPGRKLSDEDIDRLPEIIQEIQQSRKDRTE